MKKVQRDVTRNEEVITNIETYSWFTLQPHLFIMLLSIFPHQRGVWNTALAMLASDLFVGSPSLLVAMSIYLTVFCDSLSFSSIRLADFSPRLSFFKRYWLFIEEKPCNRSRAISMFIGSQLVGGSRSLRLVVGLLERESLLNETS